MRDYAKWEESSDPGHDELPNHSVPSVVHASWHAAFHNWRQIKNDFPHFAHFLALTSHNRATTKKLAKIRERARELQCNVGFLSAFLCSPPTHFLCHSFHIRLLKVFSSFPWSAYYPHAVNVYHSHTYLTRKGIAFHLRRDPLSLRYGAWFPLLSFSWLNTIVLLVTGRGVPSSVVVFTEQQFDNTYSGSQHPINHLSLFVITVLSYGDFSTLLKVDHSKDRLYPVSGTSVISTIPSLSSRRTFLSMSNQLPPSPGDLSTFHHLCGRSFQRRGGSISLTSACIVPPPYCVE